MNSETGRVVVFGSCLTSRTPKDIDFSFKGISLEEAIEIVSKWRSSNEHRWDKRPEYLHAIPEIIELVGRDECIVIAVRSGQEAKTETISGEKVKTVVVPRVEWVDRYGPNPDDNDRYGRGKPMKWPW